MPPGSGKPWRLACLLGALVLLTLERPGVGSVGLPPDDGRNPVRIREAIVAARYPEAVTLARSWKAAASAREGPESPRAREAARLLVEALWRNTQSMDPLTLSLAEHALAADEQAPEHDDAAIAASLENLGRVVRDRGAARRAAPLLDRALALREAAPERDPVAIASALSEVGWTLFANDDDDGARSRFVRAIALLEQARGPDDPAIADVLVRYAAVERQGSNYLKAKSLHERALAIRERAFGPDHPLVADSLRGIGIVLHGMTDYDGARNALERGISILDRKLPDHRGTGLIHMTMANLELDLGNYVGAREQYERSIAILEASPPSDTLMGAVVSNYATLLERTGDYEAARVQYERGLTLRARGQGPNSTSVASSSSTVGNFLITLGDYRRARELLERALAIQLKAYGEAHLSVGFTRQALARLEFASGRPREAGVMAEAAIRSFTGTFGPTHPLLGDPLDILGTIATNDGQLARARSLLDRAYSIQLQAQGTTHPLVAARLTSLARLDWYSRAPRSALDRSLKADAIIRTHFQRTARALSEREALRYEAIRGSSLDIALTVLTSGKPAGAGVRKAWDEIVRSRAMVLDEMAQRHRSVMEHGGGETQRRFDALAKARNELARLAVAGPDQTHPETYREALEKAVSLVDTRERELAVDDDAFRREQEAAAAGLDQVLAALPRDGALVAYLQYQRIAATPEGAPEPSYMAFVDAGDSGVPVAIPIGSKLSVDELVGRWRTLVSTLPRDDADLEAYRLAGTALRRALWDPVAPKLAGARSVYIVPDGELNLVALHTLPDESGDRYLVESGPCIHYLSAERDLARSKGIRADLGLLAIGGPSFDAKPDSDETGAEGRSASDTITSSCPGFQALRFPALPSAQDEVEEAEAIWRGSGRADVLALTGDRATEAAFKKDAPGRSVIHLATHSFSLGSLCPSALQASSGVPHDAAPPFAGENPLLLSGLAFAGANRRAEAANQPGGNDGILTAQEVASLDLRNTEWVILSGCESGVGPVLTGEGVLGLRRAFETAGAGTLISTLWAISDHDAREWMRALYEGRMAGRSTAEAVRDASLRIVETRRRAKASPHPFFWGAFVAAGDPD